MISDQIKILIESLENDISSHENNNFENIAEKYDEVYASLLEIGDYEIRNVQIALNFWDSWCDSSNHEWKFYENINKEDWPILAKTIIESLKGESEIQNPIIISNFAPENVKGIFAKFKDTFFRK